MNAFVFLSLIAVAAASYGGSQSYHGRYAGKCGNDGFYYNTHSSFVICSNGNAYHQPCAPGSRNSGYNQYTYGGKYGYSDFCDVNLVDYGYGASGYGHATHGHATHGHATHGHATHGSYGHATHGHATHGHAIHGGYGHGYDIVRPDRYHNADGYATRNAYNHNNYGYGHHGSHAVHGRHAPHAGYGHDAHKTVVHKTVSVHKSH